MAEALYYDRGWVKVGSGLRAARSAAAMNPVKRLVPEFLRARVRETGFWRTRFNLQNARRLASNSKRLDLCAAEFARWLHVAKISSLREKTCLEIGTGSLATHAVVCHLLGARKVIATDVAPVLQPRFISTAIQEAVPYIVRDVLSPFEDHSEIRARLDRLRAIRHFDLDVLKSLGIEYVAPIDLAERRLGQPVDFIYSNSVLEHAPIADLPALLCNLTADLTDDGFMFHAIHLEDHSDINGAPFPFLAVPASEYDRSHQTKRGNRVRRSEWQRLLSEIPNLDSHVVFECRRNDKPLPPRIDAAVLYESEIDLRTSHLGVYAAKKAARSISMSWPRVRNESGGAESVSPIAAEPLVSNKSGGQR